MTIEVDTPEGIKRGSGVLEAQGRRTNNLDTGGQGSWAKVEGEAVAVDIAPGKTLFALLQVANGTSSDDNLAVMSMRAMDPAYKHNKKESALRIVSRDGIVSPATVRAEDYPLLVTFGDVRDPKTVARVAPDNLAATFGPGVSLKRITIAVNDDPVTTGIEKRLGSGFWKNWVRVHNEEMSKDGGVMSNPYFGSLAGRLTRDDFERGGIE